MATPLLYRSINMKKLKHLYALGNCSVELLDHVRYLFISYNFDSEVSTVDLKPLVAQLLCFRLPNLQYLIQTTAERHVLSLRETLLSSTPMNASQLLMLHIPLDYLPTLDLILCFQRLEILTLAGNDVSGDATSTVGLSLPLLHTLCISWIDSGFHVHNEFSARHLWEYLSLSSFPLLSDLRLNLDWCSMEDENTPDIRTWKVSTFFRQHPNVRNVELTLFSPIDEHVLCTGILPVTTLRSINYIPSLTLAKEVLPTIRSYRLASLPRYMVANEMLKLVALFNELTRSPTCQIEEVQIESISNDPFRWKSYLQNLAENLLSKEDAETFRPLTSLIQNLRKSPRCMRFLDVDNDELPLDFQYPQEKARVTSAVEEP
jgi:hypothetical protein